jgi:hypothetical protein
VKPITATECKKSWEEFDWKGVNKRLDELAGRVIDGFLTLIQEIVMPKEHDLKIWPQFFEPVSEGRANFQFRKNDRDYQEGDLLRLREWNQETIRDGSTLVAPQGYTGREVLVKVVYIMRVFDFGEWPPPVQADYVIMGTSLVET